MEKLSSHLHKHTYPKTLLRRPRLVRWIYRWNRLILQRNWVTSSALSNLLPTLAKGAQVVDLGCGEGLHLLPWAERFPQLQFTGIDRLSSHLEFGQRYAAATQLKNVNFQLAQLENLTFKKKAGLINCIGILQYIKEDKLVLKNIHESLYTNGLVLFYTPITGRKILPIYRYFFGKKMHYEKSQDRVRVYSEEEFMMKLSATKFRVKSKRYTYGTLGILGHEIYSLILMGMGNSGWFGWIFALLLVPLLPMILGLKWIDFCVVNEPETVCSS